MDWNLDNLLTRLRTLRRHTEESHDCGVEIVLGGGTGIVSVSDEDTGPVSTAPDDVSCVYELTEDVVDCSCGEV